MRQSGCEQCCSTLCKSDPACKASLRGFLSYSFTSFAPVAHLIQPQARSSSTLVVFNADNLGLVILPRHSALGESPRRFFLPGALRQRALSYKAPLDERPVLRFG